MKRHFKKVLSTLLMTVVSLSTMATTSFAATEIIPETGDATLKIMSYFMLPGYVTVPNVKFNINFTKDGFNNGKLLMEDATQPDLVNLSVENGEIDYTNYPNAGEEVNGYHCYALNTDNIIPAGTAFSHAGEYVYTITQASNNNSTEDNKFITYSGAEYELHVFVVNTDAGGLRVGGVYANVIKDHEGKDVDSTKAILDFPAQSQYVDGQFAFVNYYLPNNQTLYIDNTALGSMANLSNDFNFTVKLDNPSYAPTDEVKSYYGVVVDSKTMKPINTTLIEFKTGTKSGTIKMKSGQKLVFVKSDYSPSTSVAVTDEAQKCLPGGLLYQSTFLAFTGYTPSALVTHGGTTEDETKGKVGEMLNVKACCYIDVGRNSTEYKASFSDAVITGLNDNVIPFVFMMIFAAIGYAVNRTNKRRIED